jgi:hypothetical protein
MLGGDPHALACPALADLAGQRHRDLAGEGDDAERRELEREKPLRLGRVERVEGGEDLFEAIVRGGFGGGGELAQLGVAEPARAPMRWPAWIAAFSRRSRSRSDAR